MNSASDSILTHVFLSLEPSVCDSSKLWSLLLGYTLHNDSTRGSYCSPQIEAGRSSKQSQVDPSASYSWSPCLVPDTALASVQF